MIKGKRSTEDSDKVGQQKNIFQEINHNHQEKHAETSLYSNNVMEDGDVCHEFCFFCQFNDHIPKHKKKQLTDSVQDATFVVLVVL